MGAPLEDRYQVDCLHHQHYHRQKDPAAGGAVPFLQKLGNGLGVVGFRHRPDPGRHQPGDAGEGDVHEGRPEITQGKPAMRP